jgi:hypothetical protein
MTADAPFLDPFFLNIRLTALRTDEDSFFVQNSPLLLHGYPP